MGECSKTRLEPKMKEIERETKKRCTSMETQNLQSKLSKEAERIIKLKVAQDAANWMLKEELEQIESVRERQQQNLVDLQMQYESLGGDYQSEKKLREDTFHRIANTRSIGKILEENYNQIAETITRCQADKRTLFESYQRAAQVIKDAKKKFSLMEEEHRNEIQRLESQVTTEKDHKAEILKIWLETKKTLEDYIQDLKLQIKLKEDEFKNVNKIAIELKTQYSQLSNEYNIKCNSSIEKDQLIGELKDELRKIGEMYTSESNQIKIIMANKEKEIEKFKETVENLHQALEHQEGYGKSLSDEKNKLEDKMEEMEMENRNLKQQLNDINVHLENVVVKNNELQTKLEKSLLDISKLTSEYMEKDKLLEKAEEEKQNYLKELKESYDNIKTIEHTVENQLKQWTVKKDSYENTINDLKKLIESKESNSNESKTALVEAQNEIAELKVKNEQLVEENKKKINELTVIIEQRKEDLIKKTAVINDITAEIKQYNNENARLEMLIEKCQKENENLKLSECTLSEKLKLSESTITLKDGEFAKLKNKYKDSNDDIQNLTRKNKMLEKKLESANEELMTAKNSAIETLKAKIQAETYEKERPHSPILTPSLKQYTTDQIIPEKEFAPPRPFKKPSKPEPIHSYAQSPRSDSGNEVMSDSSMEVPYFIDEKEIDERFNKTFRSGNVATPLKIQPKKRRPTPRSMVDLDAESRSQKKFFTCKRTSPTSKGKSKKVKESSN